MCTWPGTIDPNMGVMKVADPSLELLTKYISTKRVVPAEVCACACVSGRACASLCYVYGGQLLLAI